MNQFEAGDVVSYWFFSSEFTVSKVEGNRVTAISIENGFPVEDVSQHFTLIRREPSHKEE
jgi:hypothetical protein